MGFFVAFHFSNASNVVALGFTVGAFEMKEMNTLMFDLDLKGCKFHGRTLLNLG